MKRVTRDPSFTTKLRASWDGATLRMGGAMTALTRAYGQQATDHILWCDKGSHEAVPVGDVEEIIRRTAHLANAVRSL
ncbi:hypothetical protein NPS70_13280 [Streptomyces sp. C10-9-1]|uniref:hypothetical protein n=1 Tax=Streptomyces sp. C10-9-1 TaxID=1859285 RepID=UPI0021122DC6|nr:hypothetical protein [Streptomyces sp. C10-9-1]MCQ6554162.1 hypothetical protein [Streptomyces sp. C10-9-1]